MNKFSRSAVQIQLQSFQTFVSCDSALLYVAQDRIRKLFVFMSIEVNALATTVRPQEIRVPLASLLAWPSKQQGV